MFCRCRFADWPRETNDQAFWIFEQTDQKEELHFDVEAWQRGKIGGCLTDGHPNHIETKFCRLNGFVLKSDFQNLEPQIRLQCPGGMFRSPTPLSIT